VCRQAALVQDTSSGVGPSIVQAMGKLKLEGGHSFGDTLVSVVRARQQQRTTGSSVVGSSEIRPPTTAFIGYDGVRERLHRLLVWPLLHPDAYDRMGLSQPRGNIFLVFCILITFVFLQGILLFGPPGTGKTHLANMLLSTMGMNVMRVRGSDLFSKYLGQSEEMVRRIFREAQQRAPSILFLDELESVAVKRDFSGDHQGGGTGVGERVLSQLLNEMDGIGKLGQVVVLACTNRPDKLDDALLRPGRFDQLVHLDLPSVPDRRALLVHLSSRIPTNTTAFVPADWSSILDTTDGLTAADICSAYRNAAIAALKSLGGGRLDLELTVSVQKDHLITAFSDYQRRRRPSSGDYVGISRRFAQSKSLWCVLHHFFNAFLVRLTIDSPTFFFWLLLLTEPPTREQQGQISKTRTIHQAKTKQWRITATTRYDFFVLNFL